MRSSYVFGAVMVLLHAANAAYSSDVHVTVPAYRLLAAVAVFLQVAQAALVSVGTISVLRFGDGTAGTTAANTAPLFVDEINPATGAVVQSVAVSGATSPISSSYEGGGSLNGDNCSAVWAAYAAPAGTASVTGSTTYNRVILRFLDDGTVDTTTANFKQSASGNARGAAGSGTNSYLAASNGVFLGTTTSTTVQSSTNSRAAVVYDNKLWVVTSTSVFMWSSVPTAAATGTAVLTGGTSFVAVGFADVNTMYITADTGSLCLLRSTYSGTAWSATTTLGCPSGFIGMIGIAVDTRGTFTMVYTTNPVSTLAANSIHAYNTATSTWSILTTASANTAFRGLSLSPSCGRLDNSIPSPSPTRTPSASPTSTRTPSTTSTATATSSSTATATSTASATATSTATSTTTASPSVTPSPSPSFVQSSASSSPLPPSATPSPTSSPSMSGTPTPSPTASVTPTPSPTSTATSSATPSPSSTPGPAQYANAINPTTRPGATNYQWVCNAGFYGPVVTATLSGGVWSFDGSVNCTACPTNTYAYAGSPSCSSCPSGTTFISSTGGCRPSLGATNGLSFYFSADKAEGLPFLATAVNGGLTYTTDRYGNTDAALRINAGSYLTLPIGSLSLPSGNSARSVSLWIKSNGAAAATAAVLSYGAWDSSAGTSSTCTSTTTPACCFDTTLCSASLDPRDGRFSVLVREGTRTAGLIAGGPSGAVTTSTTLDDSKWHHVVATFDSTTRVLTTYVDGVSVLSTTLSYNTALAAVSTLVVGGSVPASDIATGTTPVASNLFDGTVDDLRIYNRALTAAEVAAIYLPVLPTYSNAQNPTAAVGTSTYTWSCVAGFAGPRQTYAQNADLSWSYTGSVNCSACSMGSYSLAGATSCTLCPAGKFGSATGLTTAACSGNCDAGFVCPAGSTTARTQSCGSVNVYCPAGSASPTSVSAGFYSTPLAAPLNQRSTQTACPNNRRCVAGVLFPPVDMATTCGAAGLTTELTDETKNAVFGPVIAAETPGWSSPNVTFSIIDRVAADSGCPLGAYTFGLSSVTLNTTRARIGGASVDASLCSSGLTLKLRAARWPYTADDDLVTYPAYQDTCLLFVMPISSLAAPVVNVCKDATVTERDNVNTDYGAVVSATSRSVATVITYAVNASTSSPAGATLPFGIDCNGALFNNRVVLYRTATSYNVTIRIDNTGFGSVLSSYCNIRVNIAPKPLAPALTTTSLSLYDLAATGTAVGNVGAFSNNAVDASNVTTTFVAADSPDAFAIDAAGNVTVKAGGASLDALTKSVYRYTVNVSDGLAWTNASLTITLLVSARPPTTYAQSRTVSDNATAGSFLGAKLDASHPQGLALTFTLTDPSGTFAVFPNGTVYLVNASALNVNVAASYSLTFTVTDSNGRVAVAILTITVTETNKRPSFASSSYTRSVDEYTLSGASFGSGITATDVNKRDTLTYSITACSPQLWAASSGFICPLAVAEGTGVLRIAALPSGSLLADRNATFSTAFVYQLTLTATDNGSPQLSTTASVAVSVTRIRPRLTAATATILANATSGISVVSMASNVWTAYSTSTLNYSISGTIPATAEGVSPAFAIGATTGQITTATPAWNYNTKSVYTFTIRCTDTNTLLTSDADVTVSLQHVNRPPQWSAIPTTDLPARSRGTVLSLSAYASDADLSVSIVSERLSYSITAGNTDTTFSINSTTGVITVANPDSPSFVYNVQTGTGTLYNLTVRVCDAGQNGVISCAAAYAAIRVVAGSIPPVASDASMQVAENSAASTLVGTVTASDEQGYLLSFTIVSGNVDNAFSLSSSTGQLRVAGSLNFEARKTYTLVVRVTNNAPVNASTQCTITVSVNDVNEAPTLPATTTMSVDENSAVGTSVGTVVGSDVDAADQGAGKLSYSIPTATVPFAINNVSGLITVKDATLDFETQATYTFTVRVTDAGNLFGEGSVTVTINNRNDAPVFTADTLNAAVDENVVGTQVTTVRATDQDANQPLSYTISRSGSVCWAFSVTAANLNTRSDVPLMLPNSTADTSVTQYVHLRVKGSGSVKLFLSADSSSISDRYEITFSKTGTTVFRCSSVCGASALLSSTTSLLPASSTSWALLSVGIDRAGVRLLLGDRVDNEAATNPVTRLTATDTQSSLAAVRLVGISASAAGTQVSSVCFASSSQSAGTTFSLASSTGILTTGVSLDFETQAWYGVEVKVTDQPTGNNLQPFNLVDYSVVTIAVTDKNEAPAWLSLVSCSGSAAIYIACVTVPESGTVGTAVTGTVPAASDPDTVAKQTLSYTTKLDSINVANGNRLFDIGLVDRVVTVRQAVLNFEGTRSYAITVTVTDSGSPALSADGLVLVNITDVNEAPSLSPVTVSVNENVPSGTAVGNAIQGTDPDTAGTSFATLSYAIIGGSGANNFTINSGTGQISVAAGTNLDFETQSSYTLTVRVTDGGGLTAQATITVNVLNVNEPPSILPSYNRTIAENVPAPTAAGTAVTGYDPDPNSQLSYAVVAGGNGTSVFRINKCSGQIELAPGSSLNFEVAQAYTINVTVTDDGVPALSAWALFTITVTDANDAPVVPDQTRTVPENSAANTLVGSVVTWTDEDTFGINVAWRTQTFSIISGNDRGFFTINSTTGQISVTAAGAAAGALNFEDPNNNRFSLLVRATDGGGLSSTGGIVTITVTDVNEAPFFADATYARAIDENCPRSPRTLGDRVGSAIVALDPDAGQTATLSFSIVGGNSLNYFVISNAGQITVTAAGVTGLDFETLSSFVLTLRVTDSGSLTAQAVVAVNVTNRQEAPVFAAQSRNVAENSAIGTLVGSPLVASDPEEGTNLRWSITGGNSQGVFGVDGVTGQLTIANPANLNFEVTPSYSLTVAVTDTGAPEGSSAALATSATITVAVDDVNEPPALRSTTFTIAENTASGATVGSIFSLATDPDAVDTKTFAILSQDNTTANRVPFAINSTTGVITVAAAADLDFEAKSTYTLVAQVTDKGGLRANATMTVTLTNVNEAPAFLASTPATFFARAFEVQDVGQALIAFVSDPDTAVPATNERMTFSIVSGNTNSIFTISSTSGQISVVNNNSLTYPVGGPGPSYTLSIRVTDAGIGGAALSATVLVTIQTIDNNRAPTVPSYTFFIDENSVVGTEIGRVFATDTDIGQNVTYTLDAAGANINRPFPFRITTIAGGNGNVGIGVISVAWDGIAGSMPWNNLDFEAPGKAVAAGATSPGFNTYTTTVTAVDSHPSRLSGTGSVRIILRDVQEPPYFAPSRVAGAATFTLTVPENAVQGTQLQLDAANSARAANAAGGISAADDDIADAGFNLTLSWKQDTVSEATTAGYFSLDARTGAVVVAAAGAVPGVLNFESAQSIMRLTAFVTDTTGRRDNATIVVRVSDVNEVHSFNGSGILTLAGAQATALQVPESATVGTPVGRISAVDVDAGLAGTLRYTLGAGAESEPFAIDLVTGVITVIGQLDYEDKDVYTPTVIVSDSVAGGFTISKTVSIEVVDVSDARISGIRLAPGEAAVDVAEAITPASTYWATHSGMTLLYRTPGNVRVILSGAGFGFSPRRLAALGLSSSPTTVTATFGPAGSEYTATGCTIISAGTEVQCTTSASAGVFHTWRLVFTTTAARAVVNSAFSTVYTGCLPPRLTTVHLLSTSPTDSDANQMYTDGGADIRIVGTNFGPAASTLFLRYGPGSSLVYQATTCTVETPHTSAVCKSSPGIGGLPFSFRVQVDVSELQVSPVYSGSLVRYFPPTIDFVASGSTQLDTRGGESFTLSGRNFGPVGTQAITVTYANAAGVQYQAAACAVPAGGGHRSVTCKTAPGIGSGHRLRITVGGQISDQSAAQVTLSYKAPLVLGLSGFVDRAVTQGGQQVYITGDQFGPETPTTADGTAIPGSIVPDVRYGRIVSSVFTGKYAAQSCRVTVAHTQITCFTAPGTGSSLYWNVTLDNLASGVFMGATTSYAQPVVAQYSGPGSRTALTSGGEVVEITGLNMGPLGSPIDSVTYGANGTEFTATGCTIVVPHTRIQCLTTVGAGGQLRWIVTIDGLLSATPSTDYGPPVITAITGAGAVDAATEGGDVVVISGAYFSTNQYLDKVTYGPGGVEFVATNCAVTQDHTQITCNTVAGTGRRLRWIVTVRSQSSTPSTMTTSYALPLLRSAQPANAPTQGGGTAVLYGSDLGLTAVSTQLQVRLDAFGIAAPPRAAVDAHWTAVRAGGAGDPAVASWIAELPTPIITTRRATARGNQSVEFIIPEGYGAARALFVLVNGLPSNVLSFSYDAPFIVTVAADRLNVPSGFLRVSIEGTSFCNPSAPAAATCGQVFVDGVQLTPQSWTHTRIQVTVKDSTTVGQDRLVQVTVNGVASNVATFSKPVPAFDLSGQGSWSGNTVEAVDSAVISFSVALTAPGLDAATVLQPRVAGQLRARIAEQLGVSPSFVILSNVTDVATGVVTRLSASDPANVAAGRRMQASPNNGTGVVLGLSVDALQANLANGNEGTASSVATLTSSVVTLVTGPSFLNAVAQSIATATGLPVSTIVAALQGVPVSSLVTTVTTTGGSASTVGGEPFFISQVMSIATVDPVDTRILIGGRDCTQITKRQDGDRSAEYGVAADSPLAIQYRTYTIECVTPAGAGKNLPVVVSVPGGQSTADPSFTFSYAAPSITDIIDATNVTTSYLSPASNGGVPDNGIPTVGTDVVVFGENFGSSSVMGLAAEVRVTLASDSLDPAAKRVITVPVTSWDHRFLRFRMPPGQGAAVDVTVVATDVSSRSSQTSRDTQPNGLRAPATLVRYRAPRLSVVRPQLGSTDGGVMLDIAGSDFGTAGGTASLAAGLPAVTINGVPCAVPSWYQPTATHDLIRCELPEGAGKDVPVVVTVAGQASSNTVPYSYAPPVVYSVSPLSAPTSGKDLDGNPIYITLIGDNLGRTGSVEFRPVYADEQLPIFTVPSSAVVLHNKTHMVFPCPEGAGRLLYVRAVIGGQPSADAVTFAYDPPSVVSFLRDGVEYRTADDCAPRVEEVPLPNGTILTKLVPRGCYPTRGGYNLAITGQSFSNTLPSVTLGGRACTVLSSTHNRIVVTVPQGYGDNNGIVVTVGRRSSPPTPAAVFAYDPPVVRSFMPNVPQISLTTVQDSEGNSNNVLAVDPAELNGYNFGFEATPVRITIGGLPCASAVWYNDNSLKCQPAVDVVGAKNVSVLVANRSTPFVWLAEENLVQLRCQPGLYGLEGEHCVHCATEQRGANCPGNELHEDLVVSLPGFWRTNVATPDPMCHPLRQHRAFCPTFLPCEPASSCLGANKCDVGYTGDRCALCENGRFYRVNGECIKCPDSPWAVVIVFVLGALIALAAAYLMNRKKVNLALISIGIDYAQIVAMFSRTRIRWPPELKRFFLILSAFNFNLEIIAPECAIPQVTYSGKWLFIEALPLFGWIMLALVGSMQYIYKRLFLNLRSGQRCTHAPSLVGTSIVVLRVLYIYITRTTFDVFNCAPTDPPEYDKEGKAVEFMAWNLQIVCGQPGGTHLFLVPFAVAALIIYVLGTPLAALWFMRRNRMKIKADQILRAQGLGDDRTTNSNYEFRKTWHKLYYHFVPGKWYFELVITARKFLVAFTSLMFRQTPSYQLAVALLILFVAYVLQVIHQPYLSPNTSRKVVADHKRKAMENVGFHARIEEQLRSTLERSRRPGSSSRAGVGRISLSDLHRRHESSLPQLQALAANYWFMRVLDYNTVEAVMLASAVLVNLAGIMFDSARFNGSLAKFYTNEYDSLAYATIALLVLTIVYWFLCLIADLVAVCQPAAAKRALMGLSRGSAALGVKARSAAGKAKDQIAAKIMHVDPAPTAAGGMLEMTNNPFLRTAGGLGGADAARDPTVAQKVAADITSMRAPPDETQWALIREIIASMQQRNTELLEERKLYAKDSGLASIGAVPLAVSASGGDSALVKQRVNPLTGRLKKIEYEPLTVAGGGAAAGLPAHTGVASLRGLRGFKASSTGAGAAAPPPSAAPAPPPPASTATTAAEQLAVPEPVFADTAPRNTAAESAVTPAATS